MYKILPGVPALEVRNINLWAPTCYTAVHKISNGGEIIFCPVIQKKILVISESRGFNDWMFILGDEVK